MKPLERLLVCFLLCAGWSGAFAQEKNLFHPQAHSHNDYLQRYPLFDALEQGFCGIEADIFLVNGELLVAHDLEKVDYKKTLEKLYLAPLKERVEKNKGRVHLNGPSILLLIDIKTNAAFVYPMLMKQLSKYRSMLTYASGDRVFTNAVTIVLSGDRPRDLMLKEEKRFAFYDGRFENIGQGEKPSFMPLISDNWSKRLAWKGEGPIAQADLDALNGWVKKVHAEGKQIRFWGAPDHPAAWAILKNAGVDWINTDRLQPLAGFLSKGEK